jgi:hypothetical protein
MIDRENPDSNLHIFSCPFCGHEPRLDNLLDSLHPVDRARTMWEFSCADNEGGCNASVLGDSPEHCIEKWNRRAT